MIDLTNHVCLVKNTAEDSFGTGFCVHRDQGVTYVVTCAHVISNAEPEQIKVEGVSAQQISTGERSIDLAVLEVMGLEEKSLLQQFGLGQPGRLIQIPGIWEPHRSTLVKRVLDGQLMKAIRLESPSGLGWVEAWDLNIVSEGYELRGGYSGSPVIDVETGEVIGVTSHRASQGYKGIAIAIESLSRVWKDIPHELLTATNIESEDRVSNQLKQQYTEQLEARLEQLDRNIATRKREIERLEESISDVDVDRPYIENYSSRARVSDKQRANLEQKRLTEEESLNKLVQERAEITRELKRRNFQPYTF